MLDATISKEKDSKSPTFALPAAVAKPTQHAKNSVSNTDESTDVDLDDLTEVETNSQSISHLFNSLKLLNYLLLRKKSNQPIPASKVIMEDLKINVSCYHKTVLILKEEGFLAKEKWNITDVFFPNKVDPSKERNKSKFNVVAVLSYILEQQQMHGIIPTSYQIKTYFNVSPFRCNNVLTELESEGFVSLIEPDVNSQPLETKNAKVINTPIPIIMQKKAKLTEAEYRPRGRRFNSIELLSYIYQKHQQQQEIPSWQNICDDLKISRQTYHTATRELESADLIVLNLNLISDICLPKISQKNSNRITATKLLSHILFLHSQYQRIPTTDEIMQDFINTTTRFKMCALELANCKLITFEKDEITSISYYNLLQKDEMRNKQGEVNLQPAAQEPQSSEQRLAALLDEEIEINDVVEKAVAPAPKAIQLSSKASQAVTNAVLTTQGLIYPNVKERKR